ncbi:MAG: hypothetical protein RR075_03250, partial [Pygmaiobacter sp.]
MLSQDAPVAYQTRRDESLERITIEKTQEETFCPPALSVQTSFLSSPQNAAQGANDVNYLGEAFSTYIVAQWKDSLVLIDKHAAHERILYEQLMQNYGAVDGQLLMEPISVSLCAEDKNAVAENEELLLKAGFEVEDFGGNSVLVRAVPVDAATTNIVALTEEIAHKLAMNPRNTLSEKTDWILHSIACRAAIKAGDKDRPEALLILATDILNGVVPPFCPHG